MWTQGGQSHSNVLPGDISQERTPNAQDFHIPTPGKQNSQRSYEWLRHWQFWLALLLGAFLRLWRLDLSLFIFDQTALMTIARQAVLQHALPVTGITSSIHTLNPPLSIYLLVPFTLLDKDPFPAIVALALWNVLGIALCYIFVLQYFGRRMAAISTLLFAACGAAVTYSRFLWQQNYLPPLMILWALCIFAGCIRGRSRMFGWSVVLLTLAVQLHPTAALFAAILVVAVALAPRLPSWRSVAVSGVVVVLLFVPTLIWEQVSHHSDIAGFKRYLSFHSTIDLTVFLRLYEVLEGPNTLRGGYPASAPPTSPREILTFLVSAPMRQVLGEHAPYAAGAPVYLVLGLMASALFAFGWCVLSIQVGRPAWRIWASRDGAAPLLQQFTQTLMTLWRQLRADAVWKARLLLWLSVTLPLAALISHRSAVYTHYLLFLYPFVFIVSSAGICWLYERLPTRWGVRYGAWRVPLVPASMLALVGIFVIGQSAQSLLYVQSIATGQFDASADTYGYPLSQVWGADRSLSIVQQREHAQSVYIQAAHGAEDAVELNYLLVREHPERVGVTDSCLVLPPATAGSTLMVTTTRTWPAMQVATLPNATRVTTFAMPGHDPFTVYRLSGTLALLRDEVAIGPFSYRDAEGNAFRLEAIAHTGADQWRLRWTALTIGQTTDSVALDATSVGAHSDQHILASATSPLDCAATHWQGGETVFTWVQTSASAASAGTANDVLALQARSRVNSTRYDMTRFGPLQLVDGLPVASLWREMSPPVTSPATSSKVATVCSGRVVISANLTSPAQCPSGMLY